MYDIKYCFICRPSDSTVSEDAGIEPRTVAMVRKILHGKGGLDHTTWFQKAEDGLRATRSTADPYNLKVRHGRLDQRRNFFSIRYLTCGRRLEPDTGGSEKSGLQSFI
jgi:hypothetical protein